MRHMRHFANWLGKTAEIPIVLDGVEEADAAVGEADVEVEEMEVDAPTAKGEGEGEARTCLAETLLLGRLPWQRSPRLTMTLSVTLP